MFKQKISQLLSKIAEIDKDTFSVDYPNSEFGDYATNIALVLAKKKKKSPLKIAQDIVRLLKKEKLFSEISVVPPGFINFKIADAQLKNIPFQILKEGENFGQNQEGRGKKARVEFISANPTGPLHIGNARGGPIGDTLANVLSSSGYKVLREYLDNDCGNQVWELGKTLAVRAGLIKAKEEDLTYKGEYTQELAAVIKKKIKNPAKFSENELIQKVGGFGVKILFKEIIQDARKMGIKYDLVVHESEFLKKAPRVLAALEKRGLLKHKGGAVWFVTGKEKDAVVVKSDGAYTYFTADVVYHQEKFQSQYDLVVDIFGSNTSGHVPKLEGLAQALNFDLAKFKVILYQFVRVRRGKEVVKMSKRAGNFVLAREVLEEVGKDAFRFFILMHDVSTHLDFDLELAKKKALDNPVYYVQYAHARLSNILKKARVLHFTSHASPFPTDYFLAPVERALLVCLSRFPEIIQGVAKTYQVQKLPQYGLELAKLVHDFYEQVRVIDKENPQTTAIRLTLVKSSQIVLQNLLNLMGIKAPVKM